MTQKIGAHKRKLKMKAYTDSWAEGLNEYLNMIHPIIEPSSSSRQQRLTLVHCGHQTSAHLRLILDDVWTRSTFK